MRSLVLERAELGEARGILCEDEGVSHPLICDRARQRGAAESALALTPREALCDVSALGRGVAREA